MNEKLRTFSQHHMEQLEKEHPSDWWEFLLASNKDAPRYGGNVPHKANVVKVPHVVRRDSTPSDNGLSQHKADGNVEEQEVNDTSNSEIPKVDKPDNTDGTTSGGGPTLR